MKKLITVLLTAMLLIATSAFADSCYESSILSPSPFMGNSGEIFKLNDGSVWEVKYEYEYMYEYYPPVVICPDIGKLLLKNKKLNVVQLSAPKNPKKSLKSNVIESNVDDEFNGWEGETIIKLSNGQIWQQSEYYYTYHYAYRPKVIIYQSGSGFKMKVDGVDKSVGVTQLK